MKNLLEFKNVSSTQYNCKLDLDALYEDQNLIDQFNVRWEEFLESDKNNHLVLKRTRNIITYTHKSWIPISSNRKSLLILAGNPAPHSVLKDVYYSYEGNGREHRFWRVLRELGFIDLHGLDPMIKERFMNIKYNSPFRLAFEAIFTFPSPASHKKWSGVMGLEKLFGKKYLSKIYGIETKRVKDVIRVFIQNNGLIVVMQKDAYNAISHNKYNIKLAVNGELKSNFEGIEIIGTPPTRWLYTKKMKDLLKSIMINHT